MNVCMFVTMNATREFYDRLYKEKFEAYAEEFKQLNGEVYLCPCFNTLQVADYSKFNMAGFDEGEKKKAHEELFPADVQKAFDMGMKLSQSGHPAAVR